MAKAPDVAILLVEDDPDHRELALAALEGECDRSRIACAEDGEEALDFLFARGAYAHRDMRSQPRLVILDLKLGRMHGMEVLKAMRADPLTQGLPVVMLSGSADKAELDACYGAGANSVVRKSADPAELSRKMKQIYNFWVNVNESNRNSRV